MLSRGGLILAFALLGPKGLLSGEADIEAAVGVWFVGGGE